MKKDAQLFGKKIIQRRTMSANLKFTSEFHSEHKVREKKNKKKKKDEKKLRLTANE